MSGDRPARLDARALRDLVLDPGSWASWDSPVHRGPVSDAYAAELAAAAAKSRQDESIITGEGLLVDVEHATLGRLQVPGPPLRFFAPGPDGESETTRRDHTAPPVLNADGDAIRAWLKGDGIPQPDGDDVEDGHAT